MGTDPAAVLLLLISLLYSAAAAADVEGDAMSALAKSLSGLPIGWGSGGDHCKWLGVKCSSGSVTSINLNRASLSGTLDPSISSLTSLQSLNLAFNSISGPFPSLSALSSLQSLNLASNAFSSFPNDFFSSGHLSSLQTFSLDDNPLSPWSLPTDLSGLSSLQSFSASNASLTGSIPDSLPAIPTLTSLSLSYNYLNSSLPTSLAGSAIQDLLLNNQKPPGLSGRIDVISSMPNLKTLFLQSNAFTGPIPDLSNLTSLQTFNVRDNRLTGPVPSSLTSNPGIADATLSNNLLQGPFPAFSNSTAVLDVDKGNQFCLATPGPCDARVDALLAVAGGFGYPLDLADSWKGDDPCQGAWTGVICATDGKDIIGLNFPSKQYGGVISPDIANLTALTRIILSGNNLTGTIPDTLTQLPKLQLIDLSNNDLSGKIPNFASSVKVKLSGNPRIGTNDPGPSPSTGGVGGGGGSGSPTPSGPQDSSASGNSPGGGSKHFSGGVIGGIVAAVILLVICLGFLLYFRRRKKYTQDFGPVGTQSPPDEKDMAKIGIAGMNVHTGATSELYSQGSGESAATNAHLAEAQGMIISIQALRNATNNFNENNILGRGGFGVVYKGDLNGTLVAVKRNECDMMGKKGMEEFKAEIDVLRKVRHRHLVALLGYCVDGYERLLVYEYMPEGTLGQHLFDLNASGYSALTWTQRLTIALDVARGIEYLHGLAQESFIHRDLKPSNILLDKDLRAKVSDFGLVKLADNEKSMMTRLAGTFGYLAPEYAITGKVSTKVDVYAFGVILMELITGRKVLDESLPDDESHLVACFRRNIINRDKFMKTVDSTLNLDEEAWNSMFEVAELARHCTAREPNQRPDMGHAVNVLGPLVEKWKPSQCEDEDTYDGLGGSLSLTQRLEKWQFGDSTSTDLFSSYRGNQSRSYN